MIESLIMAVASSMIPGFGLLGGIVEYVTSESPDAGKIFLLDMVSTGLPGGFFTNLGTEIAGDLLFTSDAHNSVRRVVPRNSLTLPCSICSKYSNYYVRKSGHIICRTCLANQIQTQKRNYDKIYVLNRNVSFFHSQLIESNKLIGRKLHPDRLEGRHHSGRKLGEE